MARAEALFNGKYDYAGALVEYEEVLKYKNSEDMEKLANMLFPEKQILTVSPPERKISPRV